MGLVELVEVELAAEQVTEDFEGVDLGDVGHGTNVVGEGLDRKGG